MFVINLYKFNKKPNSTKQPKDFVIRCKSCLLLDDTSIVNPRVSFRFDTDFDPTGTNYAYIEKFKRYYFITDWLWSKGLWIAQFNVDVLASYKTEIGASTQYVLRNANDYNESVIDKFYPARCGYDVQTVTMDSPFSPVFSGGSYVLGVVNSDNNSAGVGSLSYYVLTPSQFAVFRSKLLGSVEWFDSESITEISESLTKAMFNPFQYVSSCMWFPFTITGSALSSLPYGWWSLDVSCSRLPASAVETFGATVAKPMHPQSSGKAYLNDSPFAMYRFDWPCVGCVNLDSKYLYSVPFFGYICQVDLVTGGATIELKACNSDLSIDRTITILSAQIGVPVQLSQISADYVNGAIGVANGNYGGLINSAIGAIGGLFGGNGVSSIGNAIESAFAQVHTSGTNGSASAYFLPPTLQARFLRVVEDLPASMGRPLCAPRQISNLSGYTLCQSARIEIPGTYDEAERIVDYMNGGFYYE